MRPIMLSDSQREIARRVLGTRIRALDDLPDTEFPEGPRIPLHEGLLLLEYQTDWLDEPVQRVDEALAEVAKIDFSDGGQVGSRLGRRWDTAVVAIGDAVALATFLDNFGSGEWESIVDLARANLELTAVRAADVLEELVGTEEAAAADSTLDPDFGADGEFDSDISDVRSQLAEIKEMDFAAPSPDEAQLIALGGREIRTGATDAEFAAAGAVQLRLICPPETIHPWMAPDYLLKALRLSSGCIFPLVAHRAAWLTHQLLDDAFRANEPATKAELQRFYGVEAGKIMSAGLRVEEHLTSFYRDGDQLAILQAYRMLAEGVLRPFGQLVVRLEHLARGRTVAAWKQRLMLGDLVDALSSAGTELCRHLLRGTDTTFRNADAHADAVISASGEVVITTDDGQPASVSLREIETQFWLMRSALNGVDTADLVFHQRRIDPNEVVQQHTDASLAYMAKLIARDHMSTGSIERLRIDPGTVSVTVSGETTAGEVETTLKLLAKFLPSTIAVGKALDEDGALLLEVVPLTGERPGRNAPCPCGSGKKFKRCHGS